MLEIWFWQRMISPHMAHLATALARLGTRVAYVAEQSMSKDRQEQGWEAPNLPGVELVIANTEREIVGLVDAANPHSIHICQGIRSNGKISVAQRALAGRHLRQWVVMETVDDSGWLGSLKRLEYRRLFLQRRNALQGVLAIGRSTAGWLINRNISPEFILPFTYFLPSADSRHRVNSRSPGPFRFVYAGRLIPLKRIDLLINALAKIAPLDFELIIVGAGPDKPRLEELAKHCLGNRVRWLGQLPSSGVPAVLGQADCLVLPSEHDGWGAVISEALILGTPAVCSDACGASEAVLASGDGGVFPNGDVDALCTILEAQFKAGLVDAARRAFLATWAKSLVADAGAQYLLDILNYKEHGGRRPLPPWRAVDQIAGLHTPYKPSQYT